VIDLPLKQQSAGTRIWIAAGVTDTDGDARLYKKSYGKESKLSYLGHALVEPQRPDRGRDGHARRRICRTRRRTLDAA
jgi:hypothetical protein